MLTVSDEVKEKYWSYYTSPKFKSWRGRGVTDKRLEKIKPIIFRDNNFWGDVVTRHGGHATPQELEAAWSNIPRENETGVSYLFEHSIGNFFGMIFDTMWEMKIIK